MNRPVHFVEFKSPDKPEKLSGLMEKQLLKINAPAQSVNSDRWAVYVNDKLFKDWKRGIRPRSKILAFDREAPRAEISVAYESKELVIFDKPAGLPTQKTLKAFEDNLYDRGRLYCVQEKGFLSGLPYLGLHHRLDRGTSGLVLMTKQRSANKEISELFKNRNLQKQYIAYCQWDERFLDKKWKHQGAIRRGAAKKKKFFFEVHPDGDPALSEFSVVDSKEGEWLKLHCFPRTGRTHQLRVHLSHDGIPVLGDSVYGEKKSAPRLMLHAQKLEFEFKGEKISVESSSPFQL